MNDLDAVSPDPKPEPRIKDTEALARARLLWDECAACGRPPANVHHVLPRSLGGSDCEQNSIALCGSGSFGCHGAVHGATYTHDGKRWTHDLVCEQIGKHILKRRPDVIEYVLTRLGWAAGREFLRRYYLAALPADYASPT